MPGMEGSFDASQFEPKQGGGGHPVGKFPANISNTVIQPNKTNDGGMLVVTFTTPAGAIDNRYNLWNNSPKAVEIAHNELSALCHATGIFRLDWKNEGAALRGGVCVIDVADQLDKDRKPNGYVEVKKVYDKDGNEPGKKPAGAPQTQAPMTQQPNGGWGGQPAAQSSNNAPTGWGNPNPNSTPPNANPGGWSQGPSQGGASSPPWAKN